MAYPPRARPATDLHRVRLAGSRIAEPRSNGGVLGESLPSDPEDPMTFLSIEPDRPERISSSWDPRAVLMPATRQARERLDARWFVTDAYARPTLASALARGAAQHPRTPIIFHSDLYPARVELAAIHARAHTVAANLHRMGIRAGDAVAVQLPNWAQTAV